MMGVHVSRHAINRYRQRVADLPDAAIFAELSKPIFDKAAEIGAPFVKLPSGHRALLRGDVVVTVLPKDTWAGVLRTEINPTQEEF
jgi:hypothetical protein